MVCLWAGGQAPCTGTAEWCSHSELASCVLLCQEMLFPAFWSPLLSGDAVLLWSELRLQKYLHCFLIPRVWEAAYKACNVTSFFPVVMCNLWLNGPGIRQILHWNWHPFFLLCVASGVTVSRTISAALLLCPADLTRLTACSLSPPLMSLLPL